MEQRPSLYDELREKCRREARTRYIWRMLGNRGPARNGAYAQSVNPFERALHRKREAQRRQALLRVLS
jgi:hypothetical protein